MSAKKKHLSLAALFCAAALLLGGCNNAGELSGQSVDQSSAITESRSDDSSGSEVSSTVSSTGGTESSETSGVPDTTGLPRMDGSTSAIPLEIGLRSGFLGISYSAAKAQVKHTTTHDSFKRLIGGEVDLIFSVPISEEQQRAADEAGVKLTMEPVAREGFVFVVNVNNPVDSLTQDQLRRIYSGEITNWKQVGGNDEPILPYQRNIDSGSQNYMTVFMGDTPLAEPKTEFVSGGMGGLMDAVAVYDNSAGAIGYSVYSYAAQMYANANKVKFIAVDGIAPSKATMADESYPLLSCTYIIYTDKSPESAREFAEKALSDEGQTYVLESGYLPVNGMEVPAKYLPYEAVGTGAPRPADFKPSNKYSYIWFDVRTDTFPERNIIINDKYFELDFLKDSAFQAQINDDIRAAMNGLRGYELPQEEAEWRERNNPSDCIDNISINVICHNGYLSIELGYLDTFHLDMDRIYFKVETLNYDLFLGKRLDHYSDLFYEGEEFMPDVNKQFSEYVNQSFLDKKLDFSGILGEPRLFTIEGVGLESDNLYFNCAPFIYYDDKFNFHSTVTEYRDMKSIVKERYIENVQDVYYNNEWEKNYIEEDGDVYLRYVGSSFHTAAEVKAQDELWHGLQKRAWTAFKMLDPKWRSEHISIHLYKNENYYSVGHFSVDVDGTLNAIFDADTLETITMEMLIGENWQQYLDYEDMDSAESELYPSFWLDNDDGTVSLYAYTGKSRGDIHYIHMAHLTVPRDKMNKRYLSDQ